LSDIKSGVSLYFLSGDRYLGDGDTDRRGLSSGQVFSPFGDNIFMGHQVWVKKGARVDHFWPVRYRFLPFDGECLENGKLERYMSITA